jgi:hypothetical protein
MHAFVQGRIDTSHAAPYLHRIAVSRQQSRTAHGGMVAHQVGAEKQRSIVIFVHDADFIAGHD